MLDFEGGREVVRVCDTAATLFHQNAGMSDGRVFTGEGDLVDTG